MIITCIFLIISVFLMVVGLIMVLPFGKSTFDFYSDSRWYGGFIVCLIGVVFAMLALGFSH